MTSGNYPVQAFAALKAAKPPATPRGRERQEILTQEARTAASRRDRIAKHEWAKRRVCSILQLARFDQWNGFVPPRFRPEPNHPAEGIKPNTSEGRSLLIELLNDVQHFEQTGELPDYAAETTGGE